MKKTAFACVLLAVVVCVCGFFCVAPNTNQAVAVAPAAQVNVATQNMGSALGAENPILVSRLTNMLNHNFVYNNDFSDMNTVINNSVLALLDKREGDYISTDILFPYIYNMYGISAYCDDDLNADFARKEGAVYIVPRGYSRYNHQIVSLKTNANGTITVQSNVTVTYHDNISEQMTCTTVFVKASDSAFGFNILSSELSFANSIAL